MQNNIIFTDSDVIGYYKDIKTYMNKTLDIYIDNEQYDEVERITELLQDLKPYAESEHLLKISNNNGMGNTISMLVVTDTKDIPF